MPKKPRFILETQRVYNIYDRVLKCYITDGGGELLNVANKQSMLAFTDHFNKWDLPIFRIQHPEYGECLYDIETGLEGTIGSFYSFQEDDYEHIDLVGTTMEPLIPLLQNRTGFHWNEDPPELS